MQRSETSIRTSHCGRLPAVGAATTAAKGAGVDSATPQVVEVIKKQIQIGIDCVGDGEFWNGRNFLLWAATQRGDSAPAAAGRTRIGAGGDRECDTLPKFM